MKKLTTGIFTVLLGLVAVDASAAITSRAYVDAKVGAVEGSVTELSTTVKEFVDGIDTTITEQITTVLENPESDIAKALAEKASASDVEDLTGRVEAAEKDIDDLQADVETLQGLTSGEGSVTNQITNALKNYTTTEDLADTYATKAALTAEENARSAKDAELEGKIGALPEGVTSITQYITNTTGENSELAADIKANADAIAEAKEAVEQAQADAAQALNESIKNIKATGEDGTYVLTIQTIGDQATLKWESITRVAE